jgi:hypothetical protein
MKRNALVILLTMVFFSCTHEPSQQTQDVAGADAAAAIEAFAMCDEALMWLWDPVGAGAFVATYASVMSIDAAGQYRTIPRDYLLPDEFLVRDNPYECIGSTHNKGLRYMQTDGDAFGKLASLDTAAASTMIDKYAECNPEIDKANALRFMQSDSAHNMMTTYNIDKYRYKSAVEILQEKSLTDSTGVANFALATLSDLNRTYPKGSDLSSKIQYINSKISAELASRDSDKVKMSKLIFLTVLKHSSYYWK